MGTASGANFHQQPAPKMLPPYHQPPQPGGLQKSVSLISPDAPVASPDTQEPVGQAHDSPSESASSRETWPIETHRPDAVFVKKAKKEKEGDNGCAVPQVIRMISTVDKLSVRDVAREKVEMISERMMVMPNELLEELKSELRVILEGTGGSRHREEFLNLQKLVQGRSDLTVKSLARSHRVQLEILVAINTGVQAFLHPTICIAQSRLIEVFLYKRCRNIACQSAIPADDCGCEICSTKNGFCNLCMCVLCNKFDSEVNTCRWIGCDLCSHWTHTDCAIRVGLIGPSAKSSASPADMLFKCQACNRTSDLLEWVKDVFQHCAPGWDKEALARELDFVSRIFRTSEDPKGRKLFWKCEDVIEKVKSGVTESAAGKMMLLFFQELDSAKNPNAEEAKLIISPQEAFNRIADVVQEAVRKMEMVAEEKMRMFKRARLALETCDHELEEKAREVKELKMERHRKEQQVEELDSIVRLKQCEAEMFQLKANEARREAERLQSIALAKSEKAEQEYSYLKARLDEAEMEKQLLFEKMKLQESQRAPKVSGNESGDPSQMLMLCKIQDLLKNVYNVPPKQEGSSQVTTSLLDQCLEKR